jgi:hypothetical protein
MKPLNIDDFNVILKSRSAFDFVYFNIDLLQNSFKDITGSSFIISNKYSLTSGADFNAKLFGVTIGVKGSKEVHKEEDLTTKDIVTKIIEDNKYVTELLVYKVRLTSYQFKSTTIVTMQSKDMDIKTKKSYPKLRLLKNNTPKKIPMRTDISKYHLNTFLNLDNSFLFGPLKEYLLDPDSIFNYMPLDIESEPFYIICINGQKEFNFKESNSEQYNMISPLLIMR